MDQGLVIIQDISESRPGSDGKQLNTYVNGGMITGILRTLRVKTKWERLKIFIAERILGLKVQQNTAWHVLHCQFKNWGEPMSGEPTIAISARQRAVSRVEIRNCVFDTRGDQLPLIWTKDGVLHIENCYVTRWENHPVQEALRKHMVDPSRVSDD